MGKNLQKVQDMLDGNVEGKIQVGGHTPNNIHANRKVGDRWVDSDGDQWEQMEGYYSKVTKVAVGIFSKVCKDCESPCIKSFDKETYIRLSRCYKCQTIWEEDLKYERKNRIGDNGCKWTFWVRSQQLHQMDALEKEMEQLVFTKYVENHESGKILDASVANAIANSNIENTIKVNKALTK